MFYLKQMYERILNSVYNFFYNDYNELILSQCFIFLRYTPNNLELSIQNMIHQAI